MSLKQATTRIQNTVLSAAMLLSFTSTTGTADSRLAVGPLPETLINTEECLGKDQDGFGWDGEQSCRVTTLRLRGAALPLTEAVSDYVGSALVWNREDVANKTVRCNTYQYSNARSAEPSDQYILSRVDITFMTEDTIPSSASQENLSDVTAHLYIRGWEIQQFGKLETGLLTDFNSAGFATDNGYLFINDFESQNRGSDLLVNNFSQCFYRDEDIPLRATGYCVDYDGDGVGWNGSTSCTVAVIDQNCDYSAASLGYNRGWGFNTVTGQSCPPAPNSSAFEAEDTCINIRGNGWGWNEATQQSCRVDE